MFGTPVCVCSSFSLWKALQLSKNVQKSPVHLSPEGKNVNGREWNPRELLWLHSHALRVLLLVATLSISAFGSTQEALSIDPSQGWTLKSHGAWRLRYDHRDLLSMCHPWQESNKGDFASASRGLEIPENWRGPVYLHFYCSDDYQAEGLHPDGSWLTAEGFVGHREKQVLVDDHVVWAADVSNPAVSGASSSYSVELPLKPGQKCLLSLLVFDIAGSRTSTDKDFYQSSSNAKKREDDPDAARFQTHVYWGDLVLTDTEANAPRGERPSEKKVRSVHTSRWPLPPFGDAWQEPILLDVSAPEGIPKQGFPLQAGVPIHAAKLKDALECSLRGKDGAPIASQKTVLGKWPDDSLQWVLFDLPVAAKRKQFELCLKHDSAGFPGKVNVKELENGIGVDAGAIQLDAKTGETLSNIRLRRTPKVAGVTLSLRANDEEFSGTTESVSILEGGPFRTTIEIDGRFSALDRALCGFRIYCSAYLNLPYVKMWMRLFNDTAGDIPVSALEVRFALPAPPQKLRVPSGEAESGFVLSQVNEKTRELNGAQVDPKAPVFVAWNDGVIAVRNFRELFPKRISAASGQIAVDLAAGGGTPIVFTPGEAKSHEVWLALGDVDPVQFAATVSSPPILQNAAYFCATGAFGPARPHVGVPVLHDHMTNDFGGKQWEDFGQSFGIRDFPDSPYHGGLPKWCNNYYDRMLNLWSEWFISGDRAWHTLAFDVSRHIMDVAVVHSEVPNRDWLGALHGPGTNHVEGPWNPNLRTAGLFLYQKLTGDPDAREAFIGVADFCLRTHAGMNSNSIRDHAGPFDAICTAYQETGDVKYLDEGAARMESLLKQMDLRRGVWPEEHGSKVYRGNVPWMAAQLARPLYLWYRATGDVQAAQALVALAESIICENTDWDKPGAVSGYSHNPHYPVAATYDLLIIPMIFAAYELTEDPFFLDAAKAQWDRWTLEKTFDSPLNCYWNTPWLIWYLKQYSIIP